MNIVIAGVGGQGSLLASKILGSLFLARGENVVVNEVHGMSQRGGSVVTTVRSGANAFAPVIERGCADLLISFELLETLRNLPILKNGGQAVSSSQRVMPMPVITGAESYPEACLPLGAVIIDAAKLAEQAGNGRTANLALLGAASLFLPFEQSEWLSAIKSNVKESLLEVNLKAFELGKSLHNMP